MIKPRFLQIHTLTPYTAALLNRDDSGLAKRIPFGGHMRTRISSQCLKRRWRLADDPHSLHSIDGADAAFRSREIVTKKVFESIAMPDDVYAELEPVFQKAVYGNKGIKKKSRQTLLLGIAEVNWLRQELERLVAEADGDAAAAKTLVSDWAKGANIKAMQDATALPGGLTGALFGRMVTSDPAANITAPVHVAHAFTVHAEEAESDYFVAVDDLQNLEDGDDAGTDTIQETELTSGLFYSYVVVDIPGLVKNLGPAGSSLSGRVLHNLVHLIAEVSPGAKLGSTAPYGRAAFMLLEAGDRQPRSLSDAFRDPCAPATPKAVARLSGHLDDMDKAYATGEERRYLSLSNADVPASERGTLKELASWAAGLPERLQ